MSTPPGPGDRRPQPHQDVPQEGRGGRHLLRGAARPLLRLPGAQRRGQEHHDQDAHRPAAPHRGRGDDRRALASSRTCWRSSALIGVLPEELPLYERLTGEEYLHFAGRMYGLGPRRDAAAHGRAAGVPEPRRTSAASSSWTTRRGCGRRWPWPPPSSTTRSVLFLDEPLNGIDPVSGRVVTDLLRRLADKGVTLFFTTHVLDVVERLCDEVAIIDRGRLDRAGHAGPDPRPARGGAGREPGGRLPEAGVRRRAAGGPLVDRLIAPRPACAGAWSCAALRRTPERLAGLVLLAARARLSRPPSPRRPSSSGARSLAAHRPRPAAAAGLAAGHRRRRLLDALAAADRAGPERDPRPLAPAALPDPVLDAWSPRRWSRTWSSPLVLAKMPVVLGLAARASPAAPGRLPFDAGRRRR